MTGGDRLPPAARALVDEIEGHLLVAATRAEGRTAAARFTAPFDWLGDDRRQEVAERYEAEYLALARDSWQRTAERAGRLRGEYEERYRALRRRLLAGFLLGACAVLGCAGALVLGRG
ncbi:hypothetical protein LMJ38_16390 [Streptomyces sp. R1]|uniref:hypothetical protein n=1 Tax=Streptomyces TaxID=1883 RepID=UPI00052A521B|nr:MULTISPECIES: hypothetical protein [unclassified Streptomyces]AIV32510.1 hypothetical protein NI25_02375 [Streptomyces sp. CCM_MD2014]MCC8337505.1 hypothetical protein [Streptomyces sp. R1]MDA4887593.1 hypothetical protein [Streptomyces sp. MS2A]MYS48830.1 hypothetical protein [Streptomyces sp. SID6013]